MVGFGNRCIETSITDTRISIVQNSFAGEHLANYGVLRNTV
jgi:hypothetical protein